MQIYANEIHKDMEYSNVILIEAVLVELYKLDIQNILTLNKGACMHCLRL